jgi:hypothetical protein
MHRAFEPLRGAPQPGGFSRARAALTRAESGAGAALASAAWASPASSQGYAWGVRALRHGEIEVRLDEASARRELRIEPAPMALAPAAAAHAEARPIHASYAEAQMREGRLALTASVLEGKVLRFWLQADIALERARFFGLEAEAGEDGALARLDGLRTLLTELCVAARAGGEREAYLALATALAAAEWPPQLAGAEREAVELRLAALRADAAWRALPRALSGSAWGFAAHGLDRALAAPLAPAAAVELARVLERRPALGAALGRWTAVDELWRGPALAGLFVDGARDGGLLVRGGGAWPGAVLGAAEVELGAALAAAGARGARGDLPAERTAAWRELWSDVDPQVLARLEDRGALEACARAAVRQSARGEGSAPRFPDSAPLAPLALEVPDAPDELWLGPELGALPHTAYLRRAADGFGALARAFEDRLGRELSGALRCWSDDIRVGLDLVAELRHLEDLHRGALALVCDQLGLDWTRSGHEKLYRALGGRDAAVRFTADLAADPLLAGDLRRVLATRRPDGTWRCVACVGVAVWHGVLRYSAPPAVALYQEDGNELPPGRLAVGFQDTPIRLPHEIWIAFDAAEPPSDEAWRVACEVAGNLEELRARFAR